MNILIKTRYNSVNVDGKSQIFDYTDLIDAGTVSVEWGDTLGYKNKPGGYKEIKDATVLDKEEGEENEDDIIVYSDISHKVLIADFTPYQPIIDLFNENEITVSEAYQVEADGVLVKYVSGYGEETITRQQAVDRNIVYTEWTLEEALTDKENEINEYGRVLIEDAYANPTQGTTTDPVVHRNVVSVRRNDKSDKLAGEISLSQEEKDEAKLDQKLSEYELKIYADADKAKTNVNKLDTVDEVLAFDVSAEGWNIWQPPPL